MLKAAQVQSVCQDNCPFTFKATLPCLNSPCPTRKNGADPRSSSRLLHEEKRRRSWMPRRKLYCFMILASHMFLRDNNFVTA